MTESRQAFEAYFAESRRSRGPSKRPTFERREDGTYKDDHTQRHWWTWQQAQAQVPDCWVLVPVEPTPEMVRAADNYAFVTKQRPKGMWWWGRVYEAMLAASPKAAQPEPQPEPLCDCCAKPVSACDKWEPNCGLGQSQEHARVVQLDVNRVHPANLTAAASLNPSPSVTLNFTGGQPEQAQQSERERFEAWARREGYSVAKVRGGYALDGAPVYEEPSTHSAWIAWQAAMLAAAGGGQATAVGDAEDAARFRWQYSGAKTDSGALVSLEIRLLSGDVPTLDEVRAAFDEAMASYPPVQGSGS